MSWIRVISEEQAQGRLRELYHKITEGGRVDRVANILKVHSLNPQVLEAHLNLYLTIMYGESGLSRAQREMIAVVVSKTNSCHY